MAPSLSDGCASRLIYGFFSSRYCTNVAELIIVQMNLGVGKSAGSEYRDTRYRDLLSVEGTNVL
jgi:hypothetical protein